MKHVFTFLIALMVFGCAQPSKYTKLAKPRADQRRWIDERESIDAVIYCINGAKYATSRPFAVKNYASVIRQAYARASLLGQDVDAGVRALNYIKNVHKQAKGAKDLWDDALEYAKRRLDEDSPDHLPGIEPPQDYK